MLAVITDITFWQWVLVLGSGLGLYFLSPRAKTVDSFFRANKNGKSPNWIMLTGSLIISWVFAKSIANAADLGNKFGYLGGLAYAAYYFSFIVAGIVIYYLRKNGEFNSIHHFLSHRFGRRAVQLFSLMIAFRLFNEIWSNTMVIGSYFGDIGSNTYYISIVVFTLLTLAYSLKGGLESSIFSDVIQMLLFGILLTVILSMLFVADEGLTITQVRNSGSFSWSNGLNLLFAALLQSLSYPFHDPVLTDRGFISPLKTTLRSFIWAGIIGGICIFLFSFLGIFAQTKGIAPGALTEVAMVFGPILLLLINFIMIVSAASTLDSTFSSFSKLATIDLNLGKTVRFGRYTMVIIAVAGSLPIFFNPAILSATTISGTMVIGLTPVFIFWWIKTPKISFHLSVLVGIIIGIVLATGNFPEALIFTDGPYNELLGANVFGIITCTLVYFLPLVFHHKIQSQHEPI
ncbi:sodium:solute symporter family transporter [Crocinitomix catalasitica]|uniref:sodium:solute symporter family transporter n=1 Tax=Crocinitomix catalasitica TaxID=184607 RepID=UPI001FE1629A|nr:sodium:solute symporter [Crocinitomix catalasitica]